MLKAAVAQHHPDARPFTQGRDFQGSEEKNFYNTIAFCNCPRAWISRRERKEEKRNKRIPKAFQGFFVHCDKTRKQMKELNFPPPPTPPDNHLKNYQVRRQNSSPNSTMLGIPSFHSNCCIWKIFSRSYYHSLCWKGNDQHCIMRIPTIKDFLHLGLLWMLQHPYILVLHFSCACCFQVTQTQPCLTKRCLT